MLTFFLIVTLSLTCFFRYASKFRNPYRLIMIFGKKGSGKTTLFTKLSIKYNNMGVPVYSNTPIYGARLFNVKDFGLYQFPEGAVILIDEVKMIWDSRAFKQFSDDVRDYFILQRHHRNTIYLASQQFNIDKTIRDLVDDMYLLVNPFNVLSFAKKINKRITIHNASEDSGNESFLTEDYRFTLPHKWIFTWIPRYARFFDSFEYQNLPNIRYKNITYSNPINDAMCHTVSAFKYLITNALPINIFYNDFVNLYAQIDFF